MTDRQDTAVRAPRGRADLGQRAGRPTSTVRTPQPESAKAAKKAAVGKRPPRSRACD